MGELRELDTHLQSCDYALVPCSNECKVTESTEVRKLMAKDLAHHLAQECPRRKQQCHICSQAVEFEKMNGHQNKCPRVRISCPNEQCSDKFLRSDLESHLSLCEFESISCKYAKVGCVERPLRKDIKKHEEDDLLHFRVTTEKVLDLTAKMTELADKEKKTFKLMTELVDKEKKTSIFKLSGFQKLKRENHSFHTPSFYTSPTWYKMSVEVDANGWGDGKGTHVSVFFHLMPGDNDDSLAWPAVTIELLNQLEDKNHFCDQIEVIVPLQIMGKSKLISHTDLEYQPDKNCQYLKDDTLFFRVSVQVPDYKPWLECTK